MTISVAPPLPPAEDTRRIANRGLICRDTPELDLVRVETIGIGQSVLGRLLGYGTVMVVGTGGTRELFARIADPTAFRKAVQSQSH